MADFQAADIDGMRGKIPVLAQAEALARQIGNALTGDIAGNEPIADWETDEITSQYMEIYRSAKEFVSQVFELLPPAVGGNSEQTVYLTKLLEMVEEQNATDAERPVTNTGGGRH